MLIRTTVDNPHRAHFVAHTVWMGKYFTRRPWAPVLALLVPSLAFAHTKWFAHGPLPPYVTSEPTGLYLSVWAAVALVIVGVGIYLEGIQIMRLSFLEPRGPRAFERAATIFSMVAGAFFMIAATHGYLFSPNLDAGAGIPGWLIIAELLIGLALLTGLFDRIAAFLLLSLWAAVLLSASPDAGPVAALEDIWVVSTALFIMIMGNDYFRFTRLTYGSWLRRFEPYALPFLRLGTGATLFVLGFSEKIVRPEYGINFLTQYNWNFMQALGFPFSDYLFTLSAGSVESLFGLVFLLGIVTRLNALVLAIFFTIPLFIIGPIELAGHMPHFAAVVLLLLFGSGARLKLPTKVSMF